MDKETIIQLLSDGVISNEAAAKYFPELEEIEDEKVKKALTIYFSGQDGILAAIYCGVRTKDILAWLEKQGDLQNKLKKYRNYLVNETERWSEKQHDKTNSKVGAQDCIGHANAFISARAEFEEIFDYDSLKEKQGKQKETKGNEREIPNTAWSEKYEKGADDAIKGMNKTWSMEDKIMLQMIEDDLSFLRDQKSEGIAINPSIDKEIAWIKSLKDRIQPQITWKPSEEQMNALRWILNNIPYCRHKEEISGLLDQINELREDL